MYYADTVTVVTDSPAPSAPRRAAAGPWRAWLESTGLAAFRPSGARTGGDPSGWPRPGLWPARWVAVLVVGATVLFTGLDVLAAVVGGRTTGAAGPYAGLVLQIVCDLALLFAIRAPLVVSGLMLAAGLAFTGSELVSPGLLVPSPTLTGNPLLPAATATVVFILVQLRGGRAPWLIVGALVVIAVRPWAPALDTIALGLLASAVPALAGRFVEARRQNLADLRERAERSDREQHLLAERARAQERARLASEMHDVVSHRVSLMVLQAGALEVAATDPATREAAAALRGAGVTALDELREVVGVLRAPGPGGGGGARLATSPRVGPEAGAPELDELLESSRAAGLRVRAEGLDGLADLPASVARAVHRVVQEGLTNVHKHAPGSEAAVAVRRGPDVVAVEVRNSAPAAPAPAVTDLAATGTGSGLRGLRERVELLGGTLEHGSSADGGFVVTATVPSSAVPGPVRR
ncbi:signal transduction histidine kinase [Pseudonocardia sediminis]|uniref:histidine kinase n=1 Tax=Pseudonocardia sediminis TaxID=1397368 RepID=A0A4Q7V454_PSEST|nr:signal transduction histidine kinase [Pseudonocardia sediminis]